MKSPIGFVLLLVVALAGCDGGAGSKQSFSAPEGTTNTASQPVAPHRMADRAAVAEVATQNSDFKQVSLTQADTAASAAEAADRKIIRNANLTMEVNSTSDT